MKDLGLIFVKKEHSDTWELKPLSFDIIADLGIDRTLELLRTKTITYLSSISQDMEKIHLAVDITRSTHFNKFMERPIMGQLDIDTVMNYAKVISDYINVNTTRFEVSATTCILHLISPTSGVLPTKIFASVEYPITCVLSDLRIKVYSRQELESELPIERLNTLANLGFGQIMTYGERTYFTIMSTEYSYIKNLKILKLATSVSDDVNMIGDMIYVAQSSECEHNNTKGEEPIPVALVFDANGVPEATRLALIFGDHSIMWVKDVCDSNIYANAEKLSPTEYNDIISSYKRSLSEPQKSRFLTLALLNDKISDSEVLYILRRILKLITDVKMTTSEIRQVLKILSPRCTEIPELWNDKVSPKE